MLTTGDVRLAEEVAQTVTGQGRHRPRWASVREGLTSARGLPGGHGASETAAPGPSAAVLPPPPLTDARAASV